MMRGGRRAAGDRRAIGVAGHVHHARLRLDAQIRRSEIRLGAGSPERCERAPDNSIASEFFVAWCHTGLDNHVGRREQGIVVLSQMLPGVERRPFIRMRFAQLFVRDQRDVCTEVGEHAAREPSARVGQLDDPKA